MKLRKENYIVKPISHDTARLFIERYHYAGGVSVTSVFSFGLFEKGNDFFEQSVLGVSVWLPPTKNAAATVYEDFRQVLVLTRLAVHPCVPTNACSYLVSQSRKRIKRDGRFKCLLTYADTFKNHTGKIYLADNWEYLGLTKPTPVYVKDGRIMGRKRGGKNLTEKEMTQLGFIRAGTYPKHKFRFLLQKDI